MTTQTTRKKRILFVDDEPNVLAGLRRLLRPFRAEWEMEFAGSGPEALERMEQAPFDVIVTDMRMPGMDGAELLNRVRQRYPATVRIVLSGQSDQEAIQRSIARTHQYLSKPCDPAMLQSTVSRACALRDRLASEPLKQLVSQVTTLPSLPDVYAQVLAELQSPDASIQRVAELIAQDVGMTTKLLQLINSSFFGLPRRVESPAHAAALLGLNVLKPVVLSAGIFSQFDTGRVAGYDVDAFTEHSLATSTCAKRIAEAEEADKEIVEDSQLAGLVHDVGQLLLAANLSQQYRQVLQQAGQQDVPLRQAELELLGADHADVGAYLLGLWGLPEPIVEAVAFHHEPSRCPADRFGPLTAVHVANVLLSRSPLSRPGHGPLELDEAYLQRLGLADRLPRWQAMIEEMTSERAIS